MKIPPQPSGEFWVLGSYSIMDAERLLPAFDEAHVQYEVELDDGSTKIDPVVSVLGGKFGQAAQATIKVAPASVELAKKVHTDVFGDCLPNYEAGFFKKKRDN